MVRYKMKNLTNADIGKVFCMLSLKKLIHNLLTILKVTATAAQIILQPL